MIQHYTIQFRLNNGVIKTLDVLPLIESQKHLTGIEKLLDPLVFKKVRIGHLGELVWDYDISPEFTLQESY